MVDENTRCDFYEYNPHNILIESEKACPMLFFRIRMIEKTKYKCVLCRNNKKTQYDEASDMIECSISENQCQLLAVDVEKFLKMISK